MLEMKLSALKFCVFSDAYGPYDFRPTKTLEKDDLAPQRLEKLKFLFGFCLLFFTSESDFSKALRT